MTTSKRGFVPLDLGGISLQLRFGTNELAELEDLMGIPTHELLQDMVSHAGSRRFLRAALYAGISHDRRFGAGRNRGVALTKIGKMMDKCDDTEEGLAPVMNAVVKAFFLAFGVDVDAVTEVEQEGDGEQGPLEESPASSSP